MLRWIIYIIIIIIYANSCSCTTFIPKTTNNNLKKSEVKLKKNRSIEIKLGSTSDLDTITITNNKTNKEWIFTHKEFKLLIKSYQNWRIVSKQPPEISKIEQDNKNIYITFNYYKKSDNRTKTSILSGIIIVNKAYVQDHRKITFWRSVSVGSGLYGVFITIICIVLAL